MTNNGLARCFYCDGPITIEQRPNQYQRNLGWGKVAGIRPSGKRGGSDTGYLPEWLDQFAHAECVDLRRMGIDPGQTTLL